MYADRRRAFEARIGELFNDHKAAYPVRNMSNNAWRDLGGRILSALEDSFQMGLNSGKVLPWNSETAGVESLEESVGGTAGTVTRPGQEPIDQDTASSRMLPGAARMPAPTSASTSTEGSSNERAAESAEPEPRCTTPTIPSLSTSSGSAESTTSKSTDEP